MIDDKADDMEEFDGDFTIYDIPLPQFLKRSKLFRRLPFIPPVRDWDFYLVNLQSSSYFYDPLSSVSKNKLISINCI